MQVISKSVLAFKNSQAVFRSHSSGALPVLAITGLRGIHIRMHTYRYTVAHSMFAHYPLALQ